MMLREMIQTGLSRQIQKMRKEANKKIRDKVREKTIRAKARDKTIRGMMMMKRAKIQGNR